MGEKSCRDNEKRGTALVYVSYCNGKVAGFYTLSTHAVNRKDFDGGRLKRNFSEQISVVLLGMLGVDEHFQGESLGAHLLKDAIENALNIAALAGAKALIVDPVDAVAASFYAHFGFIKLSSTSRMALKLLK